MDHCPKIDVVYYRLHANCCYIFSTIYKYSPVSYMSTMHRLILVHKDNLWLIQQPRGISYIYVNVLYKTNIYNYFVSEDGHVYIGRFTFTWENNRPLSIVVFIYMKENKFTKYNHQPWTVNFICQLYVHIEKWLVGKILKHCTSCGQTRAIYAINICSLHILPIVLQQYLII